MTDNDLRKALRELAMEVEDLLASEGYVISSSMREPLEAALQNAKDLLGESWEYVLELSPGLYLNYCGTKPTPNIEEAKVFHTEDVRTNLWIALKYGDTYLAVPRAKR